MIQSITVDLIPNGKMPMLHASQYDDGRQVRINLTENRQAYTLTGNEVLSLAVRKADNTLVTMDIANTYGGKSYVEFATTEQMTAVSGLNFGELTITNNGTKVGSLNFYLACEPSPEAGGLRSRSEINNLNRQIDDHIDEVLPDMVEDIAPAIVEEVAPAIVREVAPSVVEDVAPAILDRLAPSAVAEAAPAVVAELVPPAVAEVAPSVVREVAPPIVEELVPIAVGDNYYNKTQTDEKIAGLIDDTEASASKVYSSNKVVEIANTKANANNVCSKAQFDNIVGASEIAFTEGGYIKMVNPESTMSDTPISYTTGAYAFVACKKGDRFTLYGTPLTAVGQMKTYAFMDSNKVCLIRGTQPDVINGLTLVAPLDGYFAVNFVNTNAYKAYKSALSIENTIINNNDSIVEIFKNIAQETLTNPTSTEANTVYNLEYPNGRTISNYGSQVFSVKSGEIYHAIMPSAPSNSVYQLAMFYDVSNNFIGFAPKSNDAIISVPARAVKMVFSGTNTNLSTLVVKKLEFLSADVEKTVTLNNDVITIETDVFIITMSKHGHNNLMDIYSIADRAGNVLYTSSSDWQGPYNVSAVNNADGDAIAEGQTYTGGNHAYSYDGATGTPTARTSSIKLIVDGVEKSTNGTYKWSDKVDVCWTNYVQGWNTKKSDGTGREILKEEPMWSFDACGNIKTSNTVTALESIYIAMYYGLQMQASWLDGGVFIPSADRTKLNMSRFVPEDLGTQFSGYETMAYDADINIKMGFNPFVDLGMGSGIDSATIKANRIHTSTSKLYIYMAEKLNLNTDEQAIYNGYYQLCKP